MAVLIMNAEIAVKRPLRKICHAMMRLDTVIPYVMRIQKIFESRGTTLGFC